MVRTAELRMRIADIEQYMLALQEAIEDGNGEGEDDSEVHEMRALLAANKRERLALLAEMSKIK
jgi:hypothetical protein